MSDERESDHNSRDEADSDDASIGRATVAGVAWITVQKWAIRIFGFVTIAVLTRLLSPEDFGTVAAASTVLPFFYLLADLGFAAYIVQVKEANERMLSTAFWFSTTAGVILFAGLAASAPVLGLAFGSPQVVPVLQLMSISVVFTSVAAAPTALLRRSMRFRTLAVQGTLSAVVGQAVAVGFALTGFGVWALVAQTLAAQLLTCVLAWSAAQWRPKWMFSRSDFGVLARFGTQVMGIEVVALIRAWAEAAIISATLGLSALGYLSIAQRLVQIVQDLTGAALVPVSSVAFAKIRESGDRLQAFYFRALRLTYAAVSLPLTVLAVTAPLVIPIVFGNGWSASYAAAQILAIAGSLTVGASLDHGLLYGLGRPGRWFAYALAVDALTVGTTALTAHWGIEAVAWGFVAVCLIATIARWFVVAPMLQTTARVTAAPLGFLFVALLADLGVGIIVLKATANLPMIISLSLATLSILIIHFSAMRWLAPSVLIEISSYLSRYRWARRIPLIPKPKEN